jgi:hypothetical protein
MPNTNVPRQTRKESRTLTDFCWSNPIPLSAADINANLAMFYVDRDLAIDQIHYAYTTAAAATDDFKISYSSTLGGSRTDVLTGQPLDGAAGDYDATFGDHAPLIPANSWVFIEDDSSTIASLVGFRIFIQGRLGVRA